MSASDFRDPGPNPIRAAVVGAGTMGAGIAMCFADAGAHVVLHDASPEALNRARDGIARTYARAVERGRLDGATASAREAAVSTTGDFDALAPADVVVEAVFEDLALKRELFGRIGALVRADALLATNTSTLDVDAIAETAPHPERSLGMHFFSPANVMKLLEVVRGARTAPETVERAVALGRLLGKIPVVVGNADGFVGNKMLLGYRREAEFLVLAGASPARVDGALEAFGFAMGPFKVSDLAGIDVGVRAKEERRKRGAEPPFTVARLADELVAAGRLGQKTGAGWYRYEAGKREAVPDPALDGFVERERERLGISKRDVADDEIVRRCVYALVNEGGRLIDAGVAASPEDVDTIWINGYGFPRARGGPMHHAASIGWETVLAGVEGFASDDPAFWTPSAWLVRQARG